MTLAFYTFSCLFVAFLFVKWNTNTGINVFCKMYLLLLTVYFGYNIFTHSIFQSFLN